jgi:hypothetical protein
VTNGAAKLDCILPKGDNGSLNEGHSSDKLIVIKINETLHSRKQQLCQNANTSNHTLISQTQLQRKNPLWLLYL